MRKTQNVSPVAANLSIQQMQAAIPKLDRRIKELSEFDIKSIQNGSDPRIDAMSSTIQTLITNIFDVNTVEYQRYSHIANLHQWPMSYMGETPLNIIHEGLQSAIETAKIQLETIKKGFVEELEDGGVTSAGKSLKAYEGLELHPKINLAAGQLFKDGHYSEAVEKAVKALNNLVRLNSGIEDKDGAQLMEAVFNPTKPILKFNALVDQSDHDEQKGFMMMFSGSVSGLRNPRAHKIMVDDPEMALEFIAFVSLLAKLADKAALSS